MGTEVSIPQNHWCISPHLRFFLPLYFDHDAFMHNALHVLDVPEWAQFGIRSVSVWNQPQHFGTKLVDSTSQPWHMKGQSYPLLSDPPIKTFQHSYTDKAFLKPKFRWFVKRLTTMKKLWFQVCVHLFMHDVMYIMHLCMYVTYDSFYIMLFLNCFIHSHTTEHWRCWVLNCEWKTWSRSLHIVHTALVMPTVN